MSTLQEAARDFLAQHRIAVAGVSRKGDVPANAIYRRLRDTGHEVFAVNPNAIEVEGARCYPNLAAIPGGVDGVVIATPPVAAIGLVRECGELGIKRAWMHRLFGQGSVDDGGVELGRKLGLTVIPGSCPMMFCGPVDGFHKCMRWFLHVIGTEAKPVGPV
jgi:predicted CoA-binding protein